MFGSFRKGEANDPEVYTASIASILANYPEEIIIWVTRPETGLAIETDFLPSVKQVYEACEKRMCPIREAEAWDKHMAVQLAERAEFDRKRNVSL